MSVGLFSKKKWQLWSDLHTSQAFFIYMKVISLDLLTFTLYLLNVILIIRMLATLDKNFISLAEVSNKMEKKIFYLNSNYSY